MIAVHRSDPSQEINALGKLDSLASETWAFLSGISPVIYITLGLMIAVGWGFYSLTGKGAGGRDSHAGREQTRRAYRNALARYMAKEDAEKIRKGEKVRRRWMQW